MTRPLFSTKSEESEVWISVSDLMAGLMMVFLLIAILYTSKEKERYQNVTEIVQEWQETEVAIYEALEREFGGDLQEWGAELAPFEEGQLTIRFLDPTILFEPGKKELTPRFKEVLGEFMPRYVLLLHKEFQSDIDEVRIEGHTSSVWKAAANSNEAFILNMSLSQARTRSVLEYSMSLSNLDQLTPWMTKKVSANGLSSAKPRLKDGVENQQLSRRVEFTIKTKSQEALARIIQRISPPKKKLM